MTTRRAQTIVQTARRYFERGVEIPVDLLSELNYVVTARGISPDLREQADRLLQNEGEW